MRLNERLAPVGTQFSGEGVNEEWEIGDTLGAVVEAQFRDLHVSLHPCACYAPKGVQEAVFHSTT